jgi:predicted O-methyltransferase YrrM
VIAPDTDRLGAYLDQAYLRGNVRTPSGDAIGLTPHSIEREQGEAMRDLALAEGVEHTIEVGLALGMSALFLCQAVMARGGRHVAIDPFQQRSWSLAGVTALRDAGVRDIVEVIEEESQLALPRLVAEGREFDFAFIDGDHRFESVLLDLLLHDPPGSPGGVDRRRRHVDAVDPHGRCLRREEHGPHARARRDRGRLPLAPPPAGPWSAPRKGRPRGAANAGGAP